MSLWCSFKVGRNEVELLCFSISAYHRRVPSIVESPSAPGGTICVTTTQPAHEVQAPNTQDRCLGWASASQCEDAELPSLTVFPYLASLHPNQPWSPSHFFLLAHLKK